MPTAAPGELKFHHLDVRAPELGELLARRRPEVVFHLRAGAGAGGRRSSDGLNGIAERWSSGARVRPR